MVRYMSGKFEDMLNSAKLSQILRKNSEEERKNTLLWVLAIIGVIASVAAIAYAVSSALMKKYLPL